MDKRRRREILAKGRPGPYWPAEPMLGGWYTEEEIEAATKSIRDSMDPTTVGFGFICSEILDFEAAFAEYCGAAEAISINGAGTGLDMAIMCLDLEPGDEVIVPAINFRAAAQAVIGQRGQVVWCEVDPRTFNMDPADVEKRITPRTRAIFPVHMNGLSAPMDELLEIAERYPHPRHGPLKVIGDAARAGAGGYKGTKIGAKGWMTVFSFHTMKLMTTLGEGGAITTNDPEAALRLRGIRQFGGAHDGWGTNYKMTKVQAAVGLVQLRRLDEMTGERVKAAKRRDDLLRDLPELTLPYEPPGYEHTYYLYTMLVPRDWAGEKRDSLMRIMEEEHGIGCGVYNRSVYADSPFIRAQTAGQELPLSDELSSRIFCVALHPLMTEEENEYTAAALWDAVERVR
ncbi:MAG: DegT/DnrJ/EryC1/StrS family aminotransferase [Caldilineaceae bacterium]|nr:DegT/DnrJ/EryC1/StrS family aminotransferase [Caldilineaceae bacterium]